MIEATGDPRAAILAAGDLFTSGTSLAYSVEGFWR